MNDLETRVNRLLRVNLRDVASSLADAFYDHLRRRFSDDDDEPTLRNALCPQWVVLAGGRGSRIDRSGRLNKNLDIWFGAKNALQLAYEHLPGDRPPIIVANPDMIRRAMLPEYHNATWEDAGAVDDSMLDPAVRDFYFGENAVLAAQPVADGTGGALRAATDALQRSEAEWVGVAFGDEAFLDRRLFIETYISHVLADADATLCGKRPDAVVDKGGLFFDSEGRFTGTKEWYDMMPDEQQYLFDALGRGEAITNTGISLIRRKPMLERFSRLWLHKNGTEYHHVDFFHLFYQDGLKTHAHVYDGEIRSGINRWINVNEGESHRYEQVRAELSEAGVRVHPDASVSFESDAGTMLSEGRLGVGCVLSGRVHLGATVTLGSYSYLEDATLTGNTSIGTRTRVARSTLDDVVVDDSDDSSSVGAPIRELATLTELMECDLRRTTVESRARLTRIVADSTVIPTHLTAQDRYVGIVRNVSLGLPHDTEPPLHLLVPSTYVPGTFTFGEKRDLPDWERLRDHVRRMMGEQIAPRATADESTRAILNRVTERLLDAEFDGNAVMDAMTPEELWGVLFELTTSVTGNADPYWEDKHHSRAAAFRLAKRLDPATLNWDRLLRLDIAANLIDLSSARMIERMAENANYLAEALEFALDAPLSIDSTRAFRERLLSGDPRDVLWLTDNDGEAVFDLCVIERLLDEGHTVTIAAKSSAASNDVTTDDVHAMMAHPRFERLREAYAVGYLRVMASGSNTVGTNLFRATPEFYHAMANAEIVISKGQGNFYTTQGLRRDIFYLLMSKGMTAEHSTGVVAKNDAPVDGLILAFVSRDSDWIGTLREFAWTEANKGV